MKKTLNQMNRIASVGASFNTVRQARSFTSSYWYAYFYKNGNQRLNGASANA
jgi:hypothetical protein